MKSELEQKIYEELKKEMCVKVKDIQQSINNSSNNALEIVVINMALAAVSAKMIEEHGYVILHQDPEVIGQLKNMESFCRWFASVGLNALVQNRMDEIAKGN